MPALTFSLDEDSVRTLRRVAERSRKPQSLIVREAIAQDAEREEVLPMEERERMLAVPRRIKQRPTRDMDIAIAACAIEHRARFWTLNPDDFRDLPGLELYEPPRSKQRS